MIKTKKILEEIEVYLEQITCNKCGETIKEYEQSNEELYGNTGLNVVYYGGYGSEHVGDGVTYSFDLCEKCLVKLFKDFKIPPDRYDPYGEDVGLEI